MTIAVTGASGNLGRLVIEDLLASSTPPEEVVAIVRDPSKVADLADRGVQVRVADYTDKSAYIEALAGVDRLLFISTSGDGATEERHANVVEAAVAAGVGHIAYTSILNASTSSNPLATEHFKTERLIQDTGIASTMLRNAFYIELYTGPIPTYLEGGAIVSATGDGAISGATRADFAAAASAVIRSGSDESRVYELGGSTAFTLSELASALSEATGHAIDHLALDAAEFVERQVAAGVPQPLAEYIVASDQSIAAGEMHTTADDLARIIGREATTYRDVLASAYPGGTNGSAGR